MKQSELIKFQPVIEQAKQMWKDLSEKAYNEDGQADLGSCVLGDGICVLVVPPRCRKEHSITIIPSREVSKCQGSLHYERYVSQVVDFLQENGLDAYYHYGFLD